MKLHQISSILYHIPSHRCLCNLVVFGAALILEQSDAFPVQYPVMTFSLANKAQKMDLLPPRTLNVKFTITKEASCVSHQRVNVGVMQQPAFS